MSRKNYFNTLTLAQKLEQLGRCRFMDSSEFGGVEALKGKKIVIVGCGAQGLNKASICGIPVWMSAIRSASYR